MHAVSVFFQVVLSTKQAKILTASVAAYFSTFLFAYRNFYKQPFV